MSYYASGVLAWTVSEEDEQRFQKILKRILIFFLILCLIWPWLPLPKIERPPLEEIAPRLATIMLEQKPLPPPPKPVEAPLPEKAPPKADKVRPDKELAKPAPKDVPARTDVARQRASKAGLLALSDDLADLRNAAPTRLQKDLKPGPGFGTATGPGVGTSGKGAPMGEGARALITSKATSGSGGIANSKFSYGTGGGGLGSRSTSQVNSPVGGGGGGGGGGGTLTRGGSGLSGRSLEEIKLVFDRNKGAIYTIYNRALRSDPSLQGKVVLKLTIAASGQVLDCQVVSSELHNPELERKLVARVKQFDFGAKNVDTLIVTYPVDFLPS